MELNNEENHPKAVPKSASKRSFDVAFLTGNAESKREKSAFTKYKDQKNNNEASEATPPSPLPEDNNATPTSLSSGLIPFSPNLMQFPALRKLLDITGAGSTPHKFVKVTLAHGLPFKSSPTLAVPSLTLPPSPVETSHLPSVLPPSLALGLSASNTCAKCGVTFRMTSDLVYHMRTHHATKGHTSYEKKREGDRLKCNVCGENFRERHHLTRHMTAHQDRNEDENREQNLLGRSLITPPTTA